MRLRTLGVASAVALVACGRAERPSEKSAAPAGPPRSASAAALPTLRAADAAPPGVDPPHRAGPLRAPTEACRALAVVGKASTERGEPVIRGAVLDGTAWVDIAAGARIDLQHVKTTRSVALEGPGRFLPCARGDEEVLFTKGTVTTTPGAGTRPGAEVLLATPAGTVRYGDARLSMRLDGAGLRVTMKAGSAAFVGSGPSDAEERLQPGREAARKSVAVDVKSLVSSCEEKARASEGLARAVLSPAPSSAPLGERASAHVLARKSAHAACGAARAALGTLAPGPERDAAASGMAAAEGRWRGVPSRL